MGTKKNTAPAAETAPEEQKDQAVQGTTAEVQTAPEIPAAFRDYVEQTCTVTAPKGLNLRQGPGMEFPVAAVLADGEVVNVLGLPYGVEVPGWALVAVDDGFGWVMRGFLTAAGKE